jgi:type VI secretion system secreted protein VgrG
MSGKLLWRHTWHHRRLGSQRQQHTDGSQWQWSHRHDYTKLGVRASSAYGDLPPIQWLSYGAGHLHGIKLSEIDLDFERDSLYREILRIVRSTAQALPLFVCDSDYGTLGLTEQRIEVGGALAERKRYQRDALTRLTGIDLDVHPGKSLRYAYDPDGRPTGSRHGTEQQHYVLDPAGNRIDPQLRSREAIEEEWRETVRRNLHDPNFNVLAYIFEDAIQSASMWFDNRITDLDGLAGGMNNYVYPTNPVGLVDPLGLAACVFTIPTGRLVCTPANPQNAAVDMPVASSNNGVVSNGTLKKHLPSY